MDVKVFASITALLVFLVLSGCEPSREAGDGSPKDQKSVTKQGGSSAEKPTEGTATQPADTPETVGKAETKEQAKGTDMPAESAKPHPALQDPSLAKETAPESFKAKFVTTKGEFVIEAQREWAPHGVDQFYNLVKIGYYNEIAFFRVIRTPRPFMAQFGIHGDPKINTQWQNANIPDDPVKQSNARGYVTFAKTRLPNSRSTQLFINYADNSRLDSMQFAPIGLVTSGMDVVDALHSGYGDGPPTGRGPSQAQMQSQGNAYLKEHFPELDYCKTATIVE